MRTEGSGPEDATLDANFRSISPAKDKLLYKPNERMDLGRKLHAYPLTTTDNAIYKFTDRQGSAIKGDDKLFQLIKRISERIKNSGLKLGGTSLYA